MAALDSKTVRPSKARGCRPAGAVALAAGVVDELELGQVVAFAGVEVVDAVRGRGVDGAGALVGGDVIGGDAEDGAVQEGVLEGGAVEACAVEAGEGLRLGSELATFGDLLLAVRTATR